MPGDPDVQTMHLAMVEFLNPDWAIPDDVTDEACMECHSGGVDLLFGSAGGIRVQVSRSEMCFSCHDGPGDHQLYRTP